MFEYYRTKIDFNWFTLKKQNLERQDRRIEGIDSIEMISKFKIAYNKFEKRFDKNDSIYLDYETFNKNSGRIEKLIMLCHLSNIKISFIIPPAIFGKWPGHKVCLQLLSRLNEDYKFDYYDYSSVFDDPELFFDHHHLNTDGVVEFTSRYLKPIVIK